MGKSFFVLLNPSLWKYIVLFLGLRIMFCISYFIWTSRENREQKSSPNGISIVFPLARAPTTIRPSRLYCAWKSAQKRQICLNFCLERKFIIVSKNMQRKRPPLKYLNKTLKQTKTYSSHPFMWLCDLLRTCLRSVV